MNFLMKHLFWICFVVALIGCDDGCVEPEAYTDSRIWRGFLILGLGMISCLYSYYLRRRYIPAGTLLSSDGVSVVCYTDAVPVEKIRQRAVTDTDTGKRQQQHQGDTQHMTKHADVEIKGFVGNSEKIQQVKQLVRRYAPREEILVCITGETGTGKQVIAEGIRDNSPRADKPFVVLDCGVIPKNLAESHLFGHVKGAFTGATSARMGKFRSAHGGTLFIDEIGNLPLELQPKLLRALETSEITPMGGEKSHTVNVRVIAATNENLAAAVEEKRFRQDLYYRLMQGRINLPSLEARKTDIPLLVEYFISELEEKYKQSITITSAAMNCLKDQKWPGNVRQLKDCVKVAFIPDPETEKVEIEIKDVQDVLEQPPQEMCFVSSIDQDTVRQLEDDEDKVRLLEDKVRLLEDKIRLLEDRVSQPREVSFKQPGIELPSKSDTFHLSKDKDAEEVVKTFLKESGITAESLVPEYKRKGVRVTATKPKPYQQLMDTLRLYGADKIENPQRLRQTQPISYTKDGSEDTYECWMHNDFVDLVTRVFFRPAPTKKDNPLYGKEGGGTNGEITIGDFFDEFRERYNKFRERYNSYKGPVTPGNEGGFQKET